MAADVPPPQDFRVLYASAWWDTYLAEKRLLAVLDLLRDMPEGVSRDLDDAAKLAAHTAGLLRRRVERARTALAAASFGDEGVAR